MATIDAQAAATAPDPFRQALHGMWSAAAPSWATHAGFVDDRGAAVAAAMVERAELRAGQRVLELACGPGGVGLLAAEQVGPGGEVVLSDVATEMVAVATQRAGALGLTNVTTRVLDLEAVAEPDATFDAVLCREGLMLVPEPATAAAELRRLLRPAGRAVVAVWGPRRDNPWLGALLDAVADHTGAPVPPPGIPGPFSLEDADTLANVLAAGGLVDVRVDEVASPWCAPSFDDWWGVVPSLAGPVGQLLAGMPDDAPTTICETARASLADYATTDGYAIPGCSLVASGRRSS